MIVVGYNQTYVNVFEADGQAELIVSIIKPAQVDLFENSFYLLVNTQDGTATGLPWITYTYSYKIILDTGLLLYSYNL